MGDVANTSAISCDIADTSASSCDIADTSVMSRDSREIADSLPPPFPNCYCIVNLDEPFKLPNCTWIHFSVYL